MNTTLHIDNAPTKEEAIQLLKNYSALMDQMTDFMKRAKPEQVFVFGGPSALKEWLAEKLMEEQK